MTSKFLLTRPNHDKTVSYLHEWTKELIDFSNQKGIKVLELEGKDANELKFKSYALKNNPNFIMFNGHGSSTCICGNDNEILVSTTKNVNLLNKKITYALACESAAELGEKVIASGGETYIGYSGPFGFVKDASRECSPAKDKVAEPFKKVANSIVINLIKGKTAKEAFETSQKICSDLISYYSVDSTNKENETIRFWLFWDQQFQTCLGNEDAKI